MEGIGFLLFDGLHIEMMIGDWEEGWRGKAGRFEDR